MSSLARVSSGVVKQLENDNKQLRNLIERSPQLHVLSVYVAKELDDIVTVSIILVLPNHIEVAAIFTDSMWCKLVVPTEILYDSVINQTDYITYLIKRSRNIELERKAREEVLHE